MASFAEYFFLVFLQRIIALVDSWLPSGGMFSTGSDTDSRFLGRWMADSRGYLPGKQSML